MTDWLLFSSSRWRLARARSKARYGSVPNSFRRMEDRSLVSAESSLRKSPCAIITICENWSRSMPKSSRTRAFTAAVRVTGGFSGLSSSHSVASAPSVVVPSPRSFGRSYAGLRSTRYRRPRCSNSSSTYVFTSGAAKSLLSVRALRKLPLGSPYRANDIASNMVVLPAPVSPQIR